MARNRGLDACTGAWICFCDGDDWYLPDFVEKLIAQAMQTQTKCVACDYQIVSKKHRAIPAGSIAKLPEYPSVREMVACGSLSSCTYLFQRELFLHSGVRYPIECRQYEELPVVPLLIKTAGRISLVKEALYCYYQRGDGSSASNVAVDSEENFRIALALLKKSLGGDYAPELEYRAIYALFYGEILNLCKRKAGDELIRARIDAYEQEYPNYLKNQYLSHLGKAKRLFLQMAHLRCIPILRGLTRLHSILIQ